jgi:hypothetical protein
MVRWIKKIGKQRLDVALGEATVAERLGQGVCPSAVPGMCGLMIDERK